MHISEYQMEIIDDILTYIFFYTAIYMYMYVCTYKLNKQKNNDYQALQDVGTENQVDE